ncbi:hypothetical protein QFZ98_005769 [Paraburkholderia youngii]
MLLSLSIRTWSGPNSGQTILALNRTCRAFGGNSALHRLGALASTPLELVYGVDSKGHVQSDLLAPHLRYLVERLALPRLDLPELLKRTGAQMRFFCYWDNESGDRVPDVPDDIRTMMKAMGGTVEIDEYR